MPLFILEFLTATEKKTSVRLTLILALAGIAAYFGAVLFVAPSMYSDVKTLEPQPSFAAKLSSQSIRLGDSFDVVVESSNSNDPADIQIMSIAFPGLAEIGDTVKIVGYDFTQSPRYVKTGDEIGSNYSGGTASVKAQYPSIEAYSRPVIPGAHYSMELKITPGAAGNFTIFAKTVAIPHSGDNSHYPHSGVLDHQNEFVEPITVEVLQ
jgi:hypothetical protein